MDSTTSNVMGVIGFALSMAASVYSAINHKRIRSKCCGKMTEASLDIETTTPPAKNTIIPAAPTL